MTDGKPYSTAAEVRSVGAEVPRTYPKRDSRLWWARPEAWSPWNWSEARDQFETHRKTKAQV